MVHVRSYRWLLEHYTCFSDLLTLFQLW